MEVAELPEAERNAAVARLCGGDAALLAEVGALLRASGAAGGFLDGPGVAAGAATVVGPMAGEREGQMIDRYKLLQPIGSGGFGSVWMAEQREPVKRRVALKIIKLGMDTRQVIARFEAERQALAMMDHPNIARVLDAGCTEAGRPYFVMEYIKGVPVMEYCTAERLGMPARLELFTRVCNAIQHAHQKGVIHRDIKPGNVLVTMHDGVPVPKVIDFGIAKATGTELTQRTLFTEHRQMIGTPAYMSPEQAEMSGLDVDTRSDIYSLGVLLYELLTGTTPFDSRELLSKGFAEMVRVLREVEPARPSTRLSTLALAAGASEPQRRQERVRHGAIHGDLDWIVMKCLEKDRNRRYDTAAALAADVQRHLADEPVLAGPPGAGYRVRKFVRRHRARVAAAGLVAAALVLGIVGTSVGLVRAVRAAEAERDAKTDAEQKRLEAERNLAFAMKGNEILGSVFEELDPAAGYATAGELRGALRENLDRAVKEIDGGSIGDVLTVAAMQHTLGVSLLRLGDAARAVSVLEKAAATREARLGESDPDTLRTKGWLASALDEAGYADRALSLEERLHALRVGALGRDHPETLDGMHRLAYFYAVNRSTERGVQVAEEAMRLAKASTRPEKSDPLTDMHNLAVVYTMAGEKERAFELYAEVARLATERFGRAHPAALTALASLAGARSSVGDAAGATELYEEVLAVQRERLGRDHPGTLLTMGNLANVYMRAGKPDRAAILYEETYKLRQIMLGATHPQTIGALSHLADASWRAGDTDGAIAKLSDLVSLNRQKFGETHPDTVNGMMRLADARLEIGDFEAAAAGYASVVEIRRGLLGKDHPDTLCALAHHGAALLKQGLIAEAELKLTAVYQGLKEREGGLSPPQRDGLGFAIDRLVDLYSASGNKEAAELWKARRGR
jgi:tetratricopeptide (TPR) repeat protein